MMAKKLPANSVLKAPIRSVLTKALLDRVATPNTGETIIRDTKAPGLVFRVRATGAKGFYFLKRFKGRLNRLKLGDFPAMGIEQARVATNAAIHEMNSGRSPVDRRRAERGELTINGLWEIYKRDHLLPRCSPRTVHGDGYFYTGHLKPLGTRRLSDLPPSVVKAHHAKIGTTSQTSANRSIQLLRRLYNYATKHLGYEGRVPTTTVQMFQENSRERFLSPDELPRFLKGCDEEGQPWADFFRLALATGARRSNVQMMEWADVDMQARKWTIPRQQSKNGREMVIPLTAAAIEILQRRRVEQPKIKNLRIRESGFIFPALRDRGAGYLSQPARPFTRICKRAEINKLTIHDLRRTAGAYLAASGASLVVIGKALGHRDHQATQIYSRLDLDPVRNAMEAAGEAMEQTLNPTHKTKGKQ